MALDVLLHPRPGHAVALASAAKSPDPAHDDVVAKCRERRAVGRYREVGIMASQRKGQVV